MKIYTLVMRLIEEHWQDFSYEIFLLSTTVKLDAQRSALTRDYD